MSQNLWKVSTTLKYQTVIVKVNPTGAHPNICCLAISSYISKLQRSGQETPGRDGLLSHGEPGGLEAVQNSGGTIAELTRESSVKS